MYDYQTLSVRILDMLRHLETESQRKDANAQILANHQLLEIHHLGTFSYRVTAK